MARVAVDYEQAVYGSFPFWDRGYAVLAHSPGCRPEWLASLRDACQRFGERPAGAIEAPSLYAIRRDSGPWMIVGVRPQGRDDQGRPGALAFHALFIDPRAYRRAGACPFDFVPALRGDWSAETCSLPRGTIAVDDSHNEQPQPPIDDRAARLAGALAQGKRVALAAPAPIDALARQVWRALPREARARASVATWAYGNGNRFDLVALPRLAGVALDSSYIDENTLQAEPATLARLEAAPASRSRLRRAFPALCVGAVLLGAGVGVGLAWHRQPPSAAPVASPPTAPRAERAPGAADRPAPPRPASAGSGAIDDAERRRVREGLFALAERFGVGDGRLAPHADPAALMAALAALRYTGPFLTPGELAELNGAKGLDSGTRLDRSLALRWHAAARRLAADRPLPPDFARGPIRWQLDTLAWSFHLDLDDDDEASARAGPRSPDEVVHALAEALSPELSLRPLPLPLTRRYPALSAYRAFLARIAGR